MRVFIAGATGAIGLPLVRALCTLGHHVVGMTRAGRGIDRLRELGAEVSVADAFDSKAVLNAIEAASADVVIDQFTWLPANPADIIKSLPNDTRLRRDGGANLLSAAQAAGVRRYIVQSRGFYLDAPEGQLADETAKLRYSAPGEIGKAARAVGEYDEQILATPSLDGVVLRYGFFYGPGTWYRPNGAIAEQVRKRELAIIGEGNAVWSFVHIDDAVAATVASLTAEQGVYNVVDDDPLRGAQVIATAGHAAAVQANTRHKETVDEGNRGDGPGCGNGRDDAGGAARAAGSDKRRRRSGSCVGIHLG